MIFLIFVVQNFLPGLINQKMLQKRQLSLAYWQSQWAIPSTFGMKERTTGLAVHLRNAALWICSQLWNGWINPRNGGLASRVSVRWWIHGIHSSEIHGYKQFLKYTTLSTGHYFYIYFVIRLFMHLLVPLCPSSVLSLDSCAKGCCHVPASPAEESAGQG